MHQTKSWLGIAVCLAGCAYGGADVERLPPREHDAGTSRPDARVGDAGWIDPRTLVDAGRVDAAVAIADAGADARVPDAGSDASASRDAGVSMGIACGRVSCAPDTVCVQPCCGGPAADTRLPCVEREPFCAGAVDLTGCTGRPGSGVACAPCAGLGLYDPATGIVACICG